MLSWGCSVWELHQPWHSLESPFGWSLFFNSRSFFYVSPCLSRLPQQVPTNQETRCCLIWVLASPYSEVGTTAENWAKALHEHKPHVFCKLWDACGARSAPSNPCGVLSPDLRSEDDFNRLNCLSLNPSAKLDSPLPFLSWIRLLKNTSSSSILCLTGLTSHSHQSRSLLLSWEESVPGQSFGFLKSVTFSRSAENWWVFYSM